LVIICLFNDVLSSKVARHLKNGSAERQVIHLQWRVLPKLHAVVTNLKSFGKSSKSSDNTEVMFYQYSFRSDKNYFIINAMEAVSIILGLPVKFWGTESNSEKVSALLSCRVLKRHVRSCAFRTAF
jgi:hypothetical protein